MADPTIIEGTVLRARSAIPTPHSLLSTPGLQIFNCVAGCTRQARQVG